MIVIIITTITIIIIIILIIVVISSSSSIIIIIIIIIIITLLGTAIAIAKGYTDESVIPRSFEPTHVRKQLLLRILLLSAFDSRWSS